MTLKECNKSYFYNEFEKQFNFYLEPIALQLINIDLRKPADSNFAGLR